MPEQIEEYLLAVEERERTPRSRARQQEHPRAASPAEPALAAVGRAGSDLRDAVAIMREHHIGCVLVVSGDRLVGILTSATCCSRWRSADLAEPVSRVMTPIRRRSSSTIRSSGR
jgi:hypothetical protein